MKNYTIRKLAIFTFILVSSLSNAQEKVRNSDFTMSVNGKTGETAMTKDELITAILGVKIDNDSELYGRVSLTGFTFKCPNQKAIVINGDKLTNDAIQYIKRTEVGHYISLYDPKFQIDGKAIKTSGNKSVIIELK